MSFLADLEDVLFGRETHAQAKAKQQVQTAVAQQRAAIQAQTLQIQQSLTESVTSAATAAAVAAVSAVEERRLPTIQYVEGKGLQYQATEVGTIVDAIRQSAQPETVKTEPKTDIGSDVIVSVIVGLILYFLVEK